MNTLNPTFIYQNWGIQGVPIIQIFALKHRLWVLVRIASTIIVLSKKIKDVKNFPMNFSIFTAEKICILYEQVFVSISIRHIIQCR